MFKRTTTTLLAATAVAAGLAIGAGPGEGASNLPITTCGQTVTTNAVLTSDLDCGGLNGVYVGASGITIDLQGHILNGNGSGVGIADVCACGHVTIKNGVVRNFDVGIDVLNGADDLATSNVVASGNTEQGVYIEGASASIRSSTASGNGTSGIQIVGSSAKVTSTTAAGNGGAGIWVDGDGSSIKSSTAAGNGFHGILLHGDTVSVVASKVSSNANGLQITGDEASVKSTTASGNEAHGVIVYGDGARLQGNRAEANGFLGDASDGNGSGISVLTFTVAPTGKNFARGNDDPAGCQPASLCPAPGSSKKATTQISTCGQVVKTNAVLTQDLVCPDMGVYAAANGITIDLNGHVLKGSGNAYGVFDSGFDHITIRNGVIRNFIAGINALNVADDVTVSNVAAVGNALFGIALIGAAPSVMSSTASGNGTDGVYLGGSGASVKSTTASGNGGNGVHVVGSSPSVVSTDASGNADKGINASGDTASIKSSRAMGNGSIGVQVFGDHASVKSTIASGNARTTPGIWAQGIFVGGDAPTISGNRAVGNGFAGGVSDGLGLGIEASSFTTPPTGSNVVLGNDNPDECAPASLC